MAAASGRRGVRLFQDILNRYGTRMAVQACGAKKTIATSALLLRLVTVAIAGAAIVPRLRATSSEIAVCSGTSRFIDMWGHAAPAHQSEREWFAHPHQSSASGNREVSLLASMATSATPAAPTRYHAGASLLPVVAISQVATSGAVPPKSAFAALKQKAKPL